MATGTQTQTQTVAAETAVRPFRVDIPEEQLVDLRRRLAATRWPERETVTDDTQGVQLETSHGLARDWMTDYGWRKREARRNTPRTYETEIDGPDTRLRYVRTK